MGVRNAGESFAVATEITGTAVAGLVRFWDDFHQFTISTFQADGNGALAGTCVQGHPGVVRQTVTDVGTVDGHHVRASSVTTCFGGGAALKFLASGQMSAVPDGVNDIVVWVGWHDAASNAGPTDGVYLELDRAGNGDINWRLCAANNGVITKVDTGIAATADSTEFAIEVNAAGDSATCTIGGVAGAAAVAANIPTTAARACGPALSTYKDLGAVARTVEWDYYGVVQP